MTINLDKDFWENRYNNNTAGWDLGAPSPPIKCYIDQLTNKELRILIPGGGNSYEAEYLHQQGFKNVTVIDLAKPPLENILKRVPDFPESNLIQGDFFDLDKEYDLVIEQTFFCAINPELRKKYVAKMHEILAENGRIAGLMFNAPLNGDKPPFGGNTDEYRNSFQDKFEIKTIKIAHNSIESRAGREVFINFIKK